MNRKQPPKFLLGFFRWFCHSDFMEDIEGDLMERFERNSKTQGLSKAKWEFFWDVIRLFRPSIMRHVEGTYRLNNYGMLKNYFKVAYRGLLRDKAFSLINISGLVIGLTASLIILQYVHFENSYDNFHSNAQQIYRIGADVQHEKVRKTILNPPPLGPDLMSEYPEVINATRLILPWSGQATNSTLSWQNQKGATIKNSFKWGFYTDPDFLKMFSFSWLKGDKKSALDGPYKVILSESTTRRIFGDDWEENENIIGETVEYINEFDRFQLTITGIMADAPENSHLQYDFLASFSTLSKGWGKGYAESWNGNGVYTYLQLAPDVDTQVFPKKIKAYFEQNSTAEQKEAIEFLLQPLQDIYLRSHREEELKANGNATNISFLFSIAILTLLIALVNYVNLTTAKAIKRGHETGIRKVMGAKRFQLIKQFLFESLILNGIAFIIAIGILQLVMPFFHQLTGKSFQFDYGRFWLCILCLFPLSTLLSGLYPAFVLSGYHPLQVMKGKLIHSRKGNRLRKGLVVFQFCVTISLILFTFTIYRQLEYMRNQDTGFATEGVLVINGPVNRAKTWIEHDKDKASQNDDDLFINTVSEYANVKTVSLSWSIPGEKSSIGDILLGENYKNSRLDAIDVDNNYAAVYGLEMLAGEFDTKNGYVINEQTARVLGYQDPVDAVGKAFEDHRNLTHNIRGVVKDYHHHSFQEAIHPLIFKSNDPTYKLDSYYSVKIGSSNLGSTLEQIEKAYQKVYPHDPFDFYFIDSYFDAQYRADIRFGVFFGLSSGFAIFIACLGLFGLSMHTVTAKTKEIGIRRVLGATAQSIVNVLVNDFLKMVLLGFLFSVPIGLYVMHGWLQEFAYRIDITWWMFALAGVCVLVISFFTIISQVIKAALTNPINALKDE